jgi:hypothetical protein
LIGIIDGQPKISEPAHQRFKQRETGEPTPREPLQNVQVREVREGAQENRMRNVKLRGSARGDVRVKEEGGVVGVGVWTRIIEGVFGW